jgi:hypothetical protein
MASGCDANLVSAELRRRAMSALERGRSDLATADEAVKSAARASQAEREIAETNATIARDRVDDALASLILADLVETESVVRESERAKFQGSAQLMSELVRTATALLSRLRELAQSLPASLEETTPLEAAINAITGAIQATGGAMSGMGSLTTGEANKENAMNPPAAPGDQLRTLDKIGGGDGGQVADVLTNSQARIIQTLTRGRSRPRVAMAVQITHPRGEDVDLDSIVEIQWVTTGGTAPRTATIELWGPHVTPQDERFGFSSIVDGTRDTGSYQWRVTMMRHFPGTLTVGSAPLGPFYLRVTVMDASGAAASDATPQFRIILP